LEAKGNNILLKTKKARGKGGETGTGSQHQGGGQNVGDIRLRGWRLQGSVISNCRTKRICSTMSELVMDVKVKRNKT